MDAISIRLSELSLTTWDHFFSNLNSSAVILASKEAILLPLMFWFIINLVNIYDKSYLEIVNFLTTQPSKFLIGLFLVIAYFFSALTISEVFEDYINDKKTKNAANKVLNFFAITIPIITIIVILNLNT